MENKLSLKKNFSFALLGNLTYAASQYAILLVFVKLYSVEDVGIFIYAGAFTSPLMLALDMQLRNFYITDHEGELKLNDYIAFRGITNFFGIIGLLVAAFFFKPEFLVVIFIVTLIKVFESQLDLLYGVYQKQHRLDYIAYSRIIRGIVALVVVIATSFIFNNLTYSLLAYFLSWFFLYFFYERKEVVKRGFITEQELRLILPKTKNLKKLLLLSFPMFVFILIDKYYLNYPRIIVEDSFGIKMLGIFGSLLYFKSLGGQLIASLAQSAIPKLSTYAKDKNFRPFNKLLYRMIFIGLLIGLFLTFGAYLGDARLLKILYTSEYAEFSNVLVVILLGATVTFSYIFIATALTCIRKQWIKLPISVISFTLLFSWLFLYKAENLLAISKIVLYVELVTFLLYYCVYVVYMKKMFKNDD